MIRLTSVVYSSVAAQSSRQRQRNTRRHKAKESDDEARNDVLDNAAINYTRGIEAGLSDEEIVRLQMGIDKGEELTPIQERYKDKYLRKIQERAEELKKDSMCSAFEAGKAAYAKGQYHLCCQLLEQAATQHQETSLLGGDIRMWLALGYQAMGRSDECIKLFKRIEQSHPNKRTRNQAKDLRYIMEAPRLKLRKDERVEMPVLRDLDRAPRRISSFRSRPRSSEKQGPTLEKTLQEKMWENYQLPQFPITNPYLRFILIVICIALAVALAVYKS